MKKIVKLAKLVNRLNLAFLDAEINNEASMKEGYPPIVESFINKERDGVEVHYTMRISTNYLLNDFASEDEAFRKILSRSNIFLKEDVKNANEAILELINSRKLSGYTFICKDDESELIFKWWGFHMLYNDTVHTSHEPLCDITEITKIIDNEGDVVFVRI